MKISQSIFELLGGRHFSKMAAWQPYWISDWAAIQSPPTLDKDESSMKNLVKISQSVLELLGGRLFSKWLPGGHIGFPIGLINSNISWIEVNHP